MRISELEGRRIAIWGYGREGRAALAMLRERCPGTPLTLFCGPDEADAVRGLGDPALTLRLEEPDAMALCAFDVVIKSPGISAYRSAVLQAAERGVRITSGTALWFAERGDARTVCVTGSKGKSTTTALVAHLLRAAGHRTALAGNIGLPLLELLDVEPPPAFWAIELSSYQTRDAVTPDVAVVLNLFPEHLDWHLTEAQYYADKLALVHEAMPRTLVLNAADTRLARLAPRGADVRWFNAHDGWHLRGNDVYRGAQRVFDTGGLRVAGAHNRGNLCAALAAIEALGLDAVALAPQALSFQPLPHRLQVLGARDGVEYINDSNSTTPQAAIAALDTFGARRVAILVGGFDRGLDWSVFAERMLRNPPAAVVTMGQNGPRIAATLRPLARQARFNLIEAGELDVAVRAAEREVGQQGVVLLSPGAPSFPRYRDYVERGRHFAQLAGFDPDRIAAIPGLGVA